MHRRYFLSLSMVLAIALVLTGCKSITQIGCVRAIFYPPEITSMKGLGPDTAGETFGHGEFTALLAKYVDSNGFVSYGALKKNDEAALDAYLKRLAGANFDKLGRHEQLAFLINAYNAFTLKLIIKNPGIKSIKDISKPWDTKEWNIAGKLYTLNDIEQRWIRPKYGEPMIHFALVCAAKSCPKLRNEAFTGQQLMAQLRDQTRHFFRQPGNFRWNKAEKKLALSSIMDWYRKDFDSHFKSLANYTLPFLEENIAAEIRPVRERVTYEFMSYSWKLNGKW